ncbi:superinfection immunity protein [Campylobacter jejuni]|nr:superinfection immunity protein [Campylobacter jejuni]EHH0179134.1 superinfection immunity protein [Campylobacter jejuni]EIJ3109205.1 superinfection immunity protein [Campylobacter jejuni]EKT3905631.1 superinfection immunity protein [Campylobacter jejuni]
MEGASGGSIFVTILLFILYMLPAIIGLSRKHSNWLIISLLNLFFGWTIIVWLVCLIWSFCRRKNKISIWKNKTSIKVEILFFYKP